MSAPQPSAGQGAVLPPPRTERGVIGWLRANLFENWRSSLLTVIAGAATAAAAIDP